MIPHHRGASQMAQLAVAKAVHPELREMAREIIAAQEEEIARMSHYLNDWYGMQPPSGAGMSPEMMAKMHMPLMQGMTQDMAARMRALETKSGAEFEIEFISAMTDHHAMAVMMAAAVLIHGHHADLYSLSEDIVITQGEEIRRMDEWLDVWYGVDRALP